MDLTVARLNFFLTKRVDSLSKCLQTECEMNWCNFFSYDSKTGNLHWKVKTNWKVSLGQKAGSLMRSGYIRVFVNGTPYLAHRIVWEMHNHKIPDRHEIDHINGIRDDNRIENLRLATRSQNQWNSCKRKTNNSGLKGVCWHKRDERWRAQITVFSKVKYIGSFLTKEDAYAARLEAEKQYHGEFARVGESLS